MARDGHIGDDARAVCYQADAVFELVFRSASLPIHLSLSIEELIEGAWEIAHRRHQSTDRSNLRDFQTAWLRHQRSGARSLPLPPNPANQNERTP